MELPTPWNPGSALCVARAKRPRILRAVPCVWHCRSVLGCLSKPPHCPSPLVFRRGQNQKVVCPYGTFCFIAYFYIYIYIYIYIYMRGRGASRIAPRKGLFGAVGPFSPPPGRGGLFKPFVLLNPVRAVCRVASIMDATRGGVRNRGGVQHLYIQFVVALHVHTHTSRCVWLKVPKDVQSFTLIFAW